MSKKVFKIYAWMCIVVLLISAPSIAQNLEVDGKAKITDMPTDNAADQIVVRQADGTLAVRDVATLYAQSTGNYGTVVNLVTGKVWLDRNLGASQVATSSTDTASYGDLYQWGRNADGHQIRTSGTTPTQASNYFTEIGLFITTGSSPFNWLSNVETHMWSGTAGENNPCPSGFRVPTAAEWEQERLTWSSNDAAGAFASPLKLPSAGYRNGTDGSLFTLGTLGHYWSSTASDLAARLFLFDSSFVGMATGSRALGCSVRCIQD
ncbi:MAG: hypothetical protein HKN76_00770 [Saprospiraceae bacterium]|nr:hypothetical protein [Saprospiraceae bacterium]